MDSRDPAQSAFVFSGFLGQDVAFERLAPLNGTACADYQALGSAFFGLHFGHGCSQYDASIGGSQNATLLQPVSP